MQNNGSASTTSILFYLEPWIEKNYPAWKSAWIPIFVSLIRGLDRAAGSKVRMSLIIGDAQRAIIDELADIMSLQIHVVEQADLRACYPSPAVAHDEGYRNVQSDSRKRLASFYGALLGSFVPDVVWSFVSPVPFFKDVFPRALILYQELGMLGRSPLPLTWYVDHLGTFANSFVVQHFDQLSALNANRRERQFVEEIRFLYRSAIANGSPLKRADIDPRNQFRHLALLPLQYNGHFIFDSMCPYSSQLELVIDVLDRTPTDIGVVVTEHKNPIAEPVLHESTVAYLRGRYRNFIYDPSLDQYSNSSLMVLECVDAVISVSSTLGLQGRFLGKALVAMGFSQLTPFASVPSLEQLGEYLDGRGAGHDDLEGAFYYLLTHYFMPEKCYLADGNWLYLFVLRVLDKHINGRSGLDFFPRIDTDERLLDFYRENAQRKLMVHRLRTAADALGQTAVSTSADNRKLAQEAEQLRLEVEALRSSMSWRITAPLRAAFSLIKRENSKK